MILAAAILLFLIASGVLGIALCRVAARGDRQTVYIAKCPEHGLHGERTTCFVCGGPVEQVPMVEAPRR